MAAARLRTHRLQRKTTTKAAGAGDNFETFNCSEKSALLVGRLGFLGAGMCEVRKPRDGQGFQGKEVESKAETASGVELETEIRNKTDMNCTDKWDPLVSGLGRGEGELGWPKADGAIRGKVVARWRWRGALALKGGEVARRGSRRWCWR